MFPIIQLGPLALQAPGLIVLLAMWIGLNASEKLAPRKGISADIIYNIVFIPLSAGIVAARLAYVAVHADAFAADWLGALALDPRLLDPWAGCVAVLIAALIIARRNNLRGWPSLDALTPFCAVLMIGIWVAHLSAGTAFGAQTNLPWGIYLWGEARHPTQIYGLIGALAAAAYVYRDLHLSAGLVFLRFVAFTAATVLFVEGLRADSLLLGNLRVLQIFAWIVLAGALYFCDRKAAAGGD
jgi:phosphatidylglycerol:prolipoprotein diacylglycerol transferase